MLFFRSVAIALFLASTLAVVSWTPTLCAASEDAQAFVEREHHHVVELLRQPGSSSRDEQVRQVLGGFVAFEGLAERAFGRPCPAAEPACEDLWVQYTDAQRSELKGLLEQLVRKTYQRNLMKTLDYDVTYRGSRDSAGDTRVLTEAKNKLKAREPAVRVDYTVIETAAGPKVVDIVTEGSSLTKNYYDQFRKKMHNPGEGYGKIVQRLRDKINASD